MISFKDLEEFCLLLDDENTIDKYIIRILKKLEKWEPIKSQIIDSKIGKSVFKLSKMSGEVGVRSLNIVNNWKHKLMNLCNDNNYKKHREEYKLPSKKSTVSIWKRAGDTPKDIIPKKKCLSLTDYYKRNPIICPNDKKNDNTVNLSKNVLNSQSGVSFLDSITVKPLPKTRKNTLLTKAELNASIFNRTISERKDVIRSQNMTYSVKEKEIEDLYVKAPCKPVMYNPKQRIIPEPKYLDRSIRNPPTLLSQCQEILLIHKEYIEEVLWTPRELLIHVLEAYNAEQLRHFESFNTRFIEEDDDLWRKHFWTKYPNYMGDVCVSWRQTYLRMDSVYEDKMQRSINTMRSRIDTIKKEDKKKQIKVLSLPRSNPNPSRGFYRPRTDPVYSLVTQKLRKQYRQLFSHLP